MASLLRAILIAVAYLIASYYAVAVQDLPGLGAIYWPAAGVAVTGLLVSARRRWPAIILAIGLAELTNNLILGFPLVGSLIWATANMVVAPTAAWTMQRWGADLLDTTSQVMRFTLVAILAPIPGALLGAVGTMAGGSELAYLLIAGQWVAGDGLGILTVVPLGLLLCRRLPTDRLRTIEGVSASAAVLLTAASVFYGLTAPLAMALAYLVLLPLLWAAVRLRMAGAAIAIFLTAQIGHLGAALGRGPFAGDQVTNLQGSVLMHLFLTTVSVATLLLASRSAESRHYQGLADAREQLIASVSHELRTPLTPIVGFSEVAIRQHPDLPQATRDALEIIRRNGQHLTRLIDELLLATRTRHRKLVPEPAVVDLARRIPEVLTERQDDATTLRIQGPTVVWADPVHVTRLLSILLDNAYRHGHPPVELEVQPIDGEVEVTACDAGEGVPGWFLPQLFDEFAQASVGDRRPSIGLGLGLPIARELARLNGGDLWHERAGDTTRFTVSLPVATDRSDG